MLLIESKSQLWIKGHNFLGLSAIINHFHTQLLYPLFFDFLTLLSLIFCIPVKCSSFTWSLQLKILPIAIIFKCTFFSFFISDYVLSNQVKHQVPQTLILLYSGKLICATTPFQTIIPCSIISCNNNVFTQINNEHTNGTLIY